MSVLRIGRGGEGLVEPSHQIALGEEVHAQQRHEVSEAPVEAERQL